MEKAGLRQITFHDLRHSGIMLVADVVPLTVLRERLGHESESTTLLYAGHRSPNNQRAAVAAVDAIFPESEWRDNGGTQHEVAKEVK